MVANNVPIIHHDYIAGYVADQHINWKATDQNLVTTGSISGKQITCISADASNNIVISHDNTDAYFKTNDGSFIFQTDEGTNTDSYLQIKGKGTGKGRLQTYDDAGNYVQMYCSAGGGYITTSSPGGNTFFLQASAQGDIRCFGSCAEGETRDIEISGHPTGGSKDTVSMGFSAATSGLFKFSGADVAYYFTNEIQVNGHLLFTGDDEGIQFGAAQDALITYDGSDLILSPAEVGSGGVKILSYDQTNYLKIYHNNSSVYFKINDGSFFFQSDEGTNHDTIMAILGKGTGRGLLQIYDNDTAEYMELTADAGIGKISVKGTTPGSLYFQPNAAGDIHCFNEADVDNAAEGKSLYVHRKAAEGDAYLRFYADASKVNVIDSVGGQYLLINGDNQIHLNWGAGSKVACFAGAGSGETPVFSISGYPSGGGRATVNMGFNASVDGQFDFTGTLSAYTFSREIRLENDLRALVLGAAQDASIYYDGSNLILSPADVGSGGVKILSSDQSDHIRIKHDNANAYFYTSDGTFVFETEETDTSTYLDVRGGGAGIGYILAKDADNSNWVQFYCSGGYGYLRTAGAAPQELRLQSTSLADVACFNGSDVGDEDEGRKFIVHRKAVEGDDNLQLYVSSGRNAIVYSDSVMYFWSANKVIIRSTSQEVQIQDLAGADIACFGAAAAGETPNFKISGYVTAQAKTTMSMGFNATTFSIFDFTGAIEYHFDSDLVTNGALRCEGGQAYIGSDDDINTTPLDVVGGSGEILHLRCTAASVGAEVLVKCTPSTVHNTSIGAAFGAERTDRGASGDTDFKVLLRSGGVSNVERFRIRDDGLVTAPIFRSDNGLADSEKHYSNSTPSGVLTDNRRVHEKYNATGAIDDYFMARGTEGSPAVKQTGDIIFLMNFRTWTSASTWTSCAGILIEAPNTHTATSAPTQMQFKTTPVGSLTQVTALTIAANSDVQITGDLFANSSLGVAVDLDVDGDITIGYWFLADTSLERLIVIDFEVDSGVADAEKHMYNRGPVGAVTDGRAAHVKYNSVGCIVDYYNSNGTEGTPTQKGAGEYIFIQNINVYDTNGSTWRNAGWLTLETDGAHASGSLPTKWVFQNVASGSAALQTVLSLRANGDAEFLADVQCGSGANFKSGDGSNGIDASIDIATTGTITVKDGIITAFA